MIPKLLSLLSIGLCAGLGDVRHGLLPNPVLTAQPSTVVPLKSKVTLRCLSPTTDVNTGLRKGETLLESLLPSNTTTTWTEFPLNYLQQHDAGEYTCEYYFKGAPYIRSRPSNVLFLLVTGSLPKPSLQSHQRSKVVAGEDVPLQCMKPDNSTESIVFALLKAGASTPIQFLEPDDNSGEFLLQTVTISATGNYSCVYYWANSPYSASHPSDKLEIWVTDPCEGCTTPPPEEDETEETQAPPTARTSLEPTGIILIVIFSLVGLLSAFFIYRYTACGAAPDKTARSPHSSKEPEEVVTDASSAMKSGSPALAEESQASRAQDPHEVNYAELDTEALSPGPSDLKKQPVEATEYSDIKI